jgi:hypothetical protein
MCEYCEQQKELTPKGSRWSIRLCDYLEPSGKTSWLLDTSCGVVTDPIYFCPMCGRNLNEE